jgi:NADPH:quinone reductase-like Zn-dependent oxidoreductase
MVMSLGADEVIDDAKEDFTKDAKTYDLIFDIIGATTFRRCQHSLKPHGVFLRNIMRLTDMVRILWTSTSGGKKLKAAGPRKIRKERISSQNLSRLESSNRSSTEVIPWSRSRKRSST